MALTEEIRGRFERVLSPGGASLGARLVDYDPEARRVVVAFEAQPQFTNILGAVHGGYVAAMLDEAAGMAAKLALPETKAVPSLDFNVSFYKAAPTGALSCEARVIRLGRRTAFMEATLKSPDGADLAHMSVTALVIDI